MRSIGTCRMAVRVTAVCLFVLLVVSGPSRVAAQFSGRPDGLEPVPTTHIAATYLDVGPGGKETPALEIGILFPPGRFHVGWMAGLMASERGGAYAYVGGYGEVSLPSKATLRPSFAVGLYEEGAGLALGSVLEFRSALAIDWRLKPGWSASIFFYHLSNGGLGSRNPGLEALGLGLSLPIAP